MYVYQNDRCQTGLHKQISPIKWNFSTNFTLLIFLLNHYSWHWLKPFTYIDILTGQLPTARLIVYCLFQDPSENHFVRKLPENVEFRFVFSGVVYLHQRKLVTRGVVGSCPVRISIKGSQPVVSAKKQL